MIGVGRCLVQTPLGVRLGLGIQSSYEVPSDLRVETWQTQWITLGEWCYPPIMISNWSWDSQIADKKGRFDCCCKNYFDKNSVIARMSFKKSWEKQIDRKKVTEEGRFLPYKMKQKSSFEFRFFTFFKAVVSKS